ncbi:MAG: ATP-grasp domain-containing protein [Muribaculaceae bacterium]|nr:ATP-grasp domain-containing protein [Muribaculaceae bacterium]
MAQKLLILGSDNGTLDLALEAKRMGLYVIVADNQVISPTKEVADEKWLISTTELDLLEKKCREDNISGILYRCDFNATQGRELCKRLGLPHYNESDEAWLTANNKRVFKDKCLKIGAPVANEYHLTDALSQHELESIEYPVVCKPVDKSGNRGMSYCANEEELINAYKYARSVSDNSTIIVERELHGPEFAVNYVIADGEPRLLFFSSEHSEPGELENQYSLITTTGLHLKQYLEEVNDKVILLLKDIGCREGVAWVETILDQDGKFYLLEMGYRFGGEMVNVPFEKISGFNSLRWMIEIALGVKHSKNDLPEALTTPSKKVAATYLMFSTREGKVGRLDGVEEISNLPNVIVDIQKREGSMVYNRSIMGTIRVFGKDIEELISTLKIINLSLKAKDENGEDMFVYFTDWDSLREEYHNGLKEFNLK